MHLQGSVPHASMDRNFSLLENALLKMLYHTAITLIPLEIAYNAIITTTSIHQAIA